MTGGVDAAVVDALPGDARVALFAGGRLVELKVARGDARGRFGAVHLGRVLRRGAGAAFVDIGGARPGVGDDGVDGADGFGHDLPGRTPRPASSAAVSHSGRPTTPLYEPLIERTSAPARPWMA